MSFIWLTTTSPVQILNASKFPLSLGNYLPSSLHSIFNKKIGYLIINFEYLLSDSSFLITCKRNILQKKEKKNTLRLGICKINPQAYVLVKRVLVCGAHLFFLTHMGQLENFVRNIKLTFTLYKYSRE